MKLIAIPDGVDGTDGRELIIHIIEKFARLSKDLVCRQKYSQSFKHD